jgi:hypothetical protein
LTKFTAKAIETDTFIALFKQATCAFDHVDLWIKQWSFLWATSQARAIARLLSCSWQGEKRHILTSWSTRCTRRTTVDVCRANTEDELSVKISVLRQDSSPKAVGHIR